MADIGVVIGQLFCLGGDSLGYLGAAIADIDAIEAGKGVEQPVAVTILDIDARASLDDAVGAFSARVLGEMGGGMEEVFPVPLVELIVGQHVV